MKQLHEYETPLTNAAWAAWTYAGPGVRVDFARDLERKLALCRDALKWIAELYDDGKPSYQVAMDAYSMKCEAAKTLAETAPKP